MSWYKHIGPGALIAAAFIGPGTLTMCAKAGSKYQFSLLWAMVVSIIITIILQEMALRLSLQTKKSLVQNIKKSIPSPIGRWILLLLILMAIVIGNSAYEGGNISGGAVGLEPILGIKSKISVVIISLLAFLFILLGNYRWLEKALIFLIICMSICFVLAAVFSSPPITPLLKGLFIPQFPEGSFFIILGLIGTTVVPYNLFLLGNLSLVRWKGIDDLQKARTDLYVSVIFGGLISLCIIISSAAISSQSFHNLSDLAAGLEPIFKFNAGYIVGIGILSAGLSSAITAPIAAGYVLGDIFDWKEGLKDYRFKIFASLIVLCGAIFAYTQSKPLKVIEIAQVANALLLPIIAIILIWFCNRIVIMGKRKNNTFQNILGIISILFVLILGVKTFPNIYLYLK